MAAAGVDYVRIKLLSDASRDDRIRMLAPLASRSKLIAVMLADHGAKDSDLKSLAALIAECGFAGAMLDTEYKHAGRLLDHMDIPALVDFTESFRARGLLTGLAGSLEAPDIPRLLLLAPDFLGFRGALCAKHDPRAGIDPQAIDVIRALIPAQPGTQSHPAPAKVDHRVFSSRASDAGKDATTDRVFVRDFVLPVRMGAYGRERGKAQNVRIGVDAKVMRLAHAVEDMRDVFSYDVITDGIRMIVAREHIAFVEMLAERIAALLLAQARVTSVTVRVEKLDVGPGAVGVEITRERPAEAAAVRHLFPIAGRDGEPKAAD
jgi:dihydroneopterin aldolase